MPVIRRPTNILRGVIRAQTREAIAVCTRLRTAYEKSPSLSLFNTAANPTSYDQMFRIISDWETALTLKD